MRDEDIKYIHELEERVQELEDIIYQDERQAVLEGMYEQNKRYREAIMSALQAPKEHGLSAGLVIKCMTQELEEALEESQCKR